MPGVYIPSDSISSDSNNTFSSESPPSYTVMENGNGDLVNPCLQVEWPNRPLNGRYSEQEHRHYKMLRKTLNRKQPPETKNDDLTSVETTVLHPKEAYQYISSTWLQTDEQEFSGDADVVPSQLLICDDQQNCMSAYASQTDLTGSSISRLSTKSEAIIMTGSEQYSSAQSQSFSPASASIVSSASRSSLSSPASRQPFKYLGPSKRETALDYLRNFKAVIFYDIELKSRGSLWKMAFNGRKGATVYDIATTKQFADGTYMWGVVLNKATPKVAFSSINNLARFYCNYPDALAFSDSDTL